ncbi:Saccharopine dehydrogenase, partial [mine drainage metagenome]
MGMKKVLVLGAGKIGSLLSGMLADAGDYTVYLADSQPDVAARAAQAFPQKRLHPLHLDATDRNLLAQTIEQHGIEALISSLPFYCNVTVAEVARDKHRHYFDLTEDVSVTDAVNRISKGATSSFVPQCGLAPGFISIV